MSGAGGAGAANSEFRLALWRLDVTGMGRGSHSYAIAGRGAGSSRVYSARPKRLAAIGVISEHNGAVMLQAVVVTAWML